MNEIEKAIIDTVGTTVSFDQTAAMIGGAPILPSESDIRVRSGVLTFSFGTGGVRLVGFKPRSGD